MSQDVLPDGPVLPLNTFYLSFATDAGFLGAVVLHATSLAEAITISHERGINPGGQVLIAEAPYGCIGDEYHGRLLSKAEAESIPEPA